MHDFIHTFTQLVAEIPATFWGVVVGSIFTLAGVYFTNRAGDRRIRLQIQSDRESASRERDMTLRKETYAAAAEAVAISVGALSKFSDLSVSLKEISALHFEQSPALARVNLVAGEDTIRALANFGTEVTGAFLRLTQKRMALDGLQQQIEVKTELLRGFEKTRDAMIELMRHHNIDGVQDVGRFEEIQRIYEFEASRIATTNKELQRMVTQLSAEHIPLGRQCFTETLRLNRIMIPLLVAARMELNLSISEERYAEILNQSCSQIKAQFDEFSEDIAAARSILSSSSRESSD